MVKAFLIDIGAAAFSYTVGSLFLGLFGGIAYDNGMPFWAAYDVVNALRWALLLGAIGWVVRRIHRRKVARAVQPTSDAPSSVVVDRIASRTPGPRFPVR